MDNKYLVELHVPSLQQTYNVYIPVNRRVGNVVALLNKCLFELSNGEYRGSKSTCLYDRNSGQRYDANLLIRQTNIKNGSEIVIF